jgi:hypothetical protein
MAYAISNRLTLLSWLNRHLGASYPFDGVGDRVHVRELDSFLERMCSLMKNLVITTDASEAVVNVATWRSELKALLIPGAPPSFVSLDVVENHKKRLMLIRDQIVKDHEASRQMAWESCGFATGREETPNSEVTGTAWATSKKDKERDGRLLTKRQLLLAEKGRNDAKPLKTTKKRGSFFEKPVPCFKR